MKKILLLATMLLSALVYGEQINYVPAEFEVQRDQTYDKNGKFAYLCQFRQHYDEKTHSGSNYPAIFFDVMMPSQGFTAGTYTVADGGLVEAAYLANVSEGIDFKSGYRFYDATEGTLVLSKTGDGMWNFNLHLVKNGSYDVVMNVACQLNIPDGGGEPVTENYSYEDGAIATYEYDLPAMTVYDYAYSEYGYVEITMANYFVSGPEKFGLFCHPEADIVIYPATKDIPAGRYPLKFDNTPRDGSAAASTGWIASAEYYGEDHADPCAFWFTDFETYVYPWFLVNGVVYVDYDESGKMGVLVEATSAKGSTFRLTSNWQDGMAVEQVEREASVVKTIENGQLVIRRGDKRFGVLGNSCE